MMLRTADSTAVQTQCYHCGDDCGRHPVMHDDKQFCCQGCRTVFQILQQNDLCNYYDLNKAAGISFKDRRQQRYEYLDDTEVQAKLIDFTDGIRSHIRLVLPQIHCSSCLWLLENLGRLDPGILQSRVDFLKKEVHLQYDPRETGLRRLVELLSSLGYAPAIHLSDLSETPARDVHRSLYYKLGLAGFAFGNIMLLSFPEYLGLDHAVDAAFARFFGYVNLILILPVILYSAQDYLRSAYQGLKQRHLNIDVPVSLGILALFGRSAYEILSHAGAGYLDSLAGLIFFLLVGKWFQQKTYHRLSFERDYKSYFPIATTRRDGQAVTIDQLAPGDEIIVRHGELIPADAILTDGRASIDYSFVTGESAAVDKTIGDRLFAGGRQLGGLLHLTVVKKVSQSYFTQLWNDESFQKTKSTGAASEIADRVAHYFTYAILGIGVATFGYWSFIDLGLAFNAFTSVLIVACPCAVALSIPFTFGNALRLLGRQQCYLKNVGVIEALTRITHIVFDKTGTITQSTHRSKARSSVPINDDQRSLLRSLAHHSAHPISRWIYTSLEEVPVLPVSAFREQTGLGIQGTVAGHQVTIGAPELVGPSSESKTARVYFDIDGISQGYFTRETRYRAHLQEVIQQLHHFGMSLLTGDNQREKSSLGRYFGRQADLHFHQKPSDKLHYVKGLQRRGEKVLMLGDGLNDAGALQQSDVGIVITENTNNFTPSSDAILHADQFKRLPLILRYCRMVVRLVYAAYGIALLYNIAGLSFAVQGLLSPVIAAILMPASSITIVLFGIGASSLAGHRLGLARVQ